MVSLIIRKMKIETAMRYNLTCARLAISNKTRNDKCYIGVEKQKPLYTVGGNVNWYSHCEIKNGTTIKSNNSTLGYLSTGNKTIILESYLYSHVHCSIIYNSQGIETT